MFNLQSIIKGSETKMTECNKIIIPNIKKMLNTKEQCHFLRIIKRYFDIVNLNYIECSYPFINYYMNCGHHYH